MTQSKQDYRPEPNGDNRASQAELRRREATDLALNDSRRPRLSIPSNQEENEHYPDVRPTNFHKGLEHDENGIVVPDHYEKFYQALCRPGDYTFAVERYQGSYATKAKSGKSIGWRPWESPLAGHYFSLEGPDPDGVAMAPAPRLGKSELCAELAEVYAMALVRDIPFADLENDGTAIPVSGGATVADLVGELNKLSWFKTTSHEPITSYPDSPGDTSLNKHESRRRTARWTNGDSEVSVKSLFRGSAPGVKEGPYLSQFLLVGTNGKSNGADHTDKTKIPSTTHYVPADGVITFGAQAIDQRLSPHQKGIDYMSEWTAWLDVQNGLNLKGFDLWEKERRSITTPRDLATYVHFDQLYQAYFNACLIMLEHGVPFDSGFPTSEGHPSNPKKTRGAFATFGGPHILSLLTEVATRALKAVRRQKFQIHRRGRPEQLAAMLTLAAGPRAAALGKAESDFQSMLNELTAKGGKLLNWIDAHNNVQNGLGDRLFDVTPAGTTPVADGKNYLLPMAFPEGSPMHAAYGAGHATVAGACVTVLKAFFEMFGKDMKPIGYKEAFEGLDLYVSKPSPAGTATSQLTPWTGDDSAVTLEGELNKLAANISIGRNMAGVHFYTDYFDSLRMGERIATGIIQEQMLNYPEPVSMSFHSFDGDRIDIRTSGKASASKVDIVVNGKDDAQAAEEWWTRHIREFADMSLDAPLVVAAAAE